MPREPNQCWRVTGSIGVCAFEVYVYSNFGKGWDALSEKSVSVRCICGLSEKQLYDGRNEDAILYLP